MEGVCVFGGGGGGGGRDSQRFMEWEAPSMSPPLKENLALKHLRNTLSDCVIKLFQADVQFLNSLKIENFSDV